MTNIYSGTIKTDGEYKTLMELTGITFTQGTVYTIQVINPAFLREGTTGSGFYIFDNKPFKYIAGSDDLYIKVKYESCDINISGIIDEKMEASNTLATVSLSPMVEINPANILEMQEQDEI